MSDLDIKAWGLIGITRAVLSFITVDDESHRKHIESLRQRLDELIAELDAGEELKTQQGGDDGCSESEARARTNHAG